MEFPQNPKIELPYDPAIPLLGIYLDKTIIQTDTSPPMYIAVLFTIAKTWKQPKFFFFFFCRQMDKDVGHIYSEILLNHKKRMK